MNELELADHLLMLRLAGGLTRLEQGLTEKHHYFWDLGLEEIHLPVGWQSGAAARARFHAVAQN